MAKFRIYDLERRQPVETSYRVDFWGLSDDTQTPSFVQDDNCLARER